MAERSFGSIAGKPVAVMGAAYRFDSEDTRNSPTLVLARLLLDRGCRVALHDPYVKSDDQNLLRFGLDGIFTQDFEKALSDAEVAFFGTGHRVYADARDRIPGIAPRLRSLVDGANLFRRDDFEGASFGYAGIGRGRLRPAPGFVDFVFEAFRAMARGLANELQDIVRFLEWTALRPSVIWGPEDEFANTFARLVPLTPLIFPIVGDENSRFQPVWVEDVASSVFKAMDDPQTIGKEYELGGPETLTLEEIERRTLRALGERRRMVRFPMSVLRWAVILMEKIFPAPPVTRSLLELLQVSNVPVNNGIYQFVPDPRPFTAENAAQYMKTFRVRQTLGPCILPAICRIPADRSNMWNRFRTARISLSRSEQQDPRNRIVFRTRCLSV